MKEERKVPNQSNQLFVCVCVLFSSFSLSVWADTRQNNIESIPRCYTHARPLQFIQIVHNMRGQNGPYTLMHLACMDDIQPNIAQWQHAKTETQK